MSQSFGMKSCTCSVLQGKASVQNQTLRTLTPVPGQAAGTQRSSCHALPFRGQNRQRKGMCTLLLELITVLTHSCLPIENPLYKTKQTNKKEQPKAQISAQKSSQCLPLAGTQAAEAESMLGASSCCELTRCTF